MASLWAGNLPEPEPVAVAIRPPLPAHADGFARHDRADFAQEFLRRNADYVAAWDRVCEVGEDRGAAQVGPDSTRAWGLVRMVDPRRPVRSAPALWRANCASQVVALAPSLPGLPGGAALLHVAALADHAADGIRDLVFDRGGVRHRFHVGSADPGAPLAILVPPLCDPLRVAACEAARRMFAQLSMSEPASAMCPSALQRQRLTLLLRVFDAWVSGATNRAIGVEIVYPWLAAADAIAWKTTSERRRVQRLVGEARELVASGYRALLRG